jgi:molybdopterin-guanine dinucleotide biosynthesis protein MobB
VRPLGACWISVIGWSGSGKTTLLSALIPALRQRGLRVAAVKHSSHLHPLHRPGSDSQRLEAAGAEVVGLANPNGLQLTISRDPGQLPALFERVAPQVDLVLIEGWKDGPFPKIEVWRSDSGPPLSSTRTDVVAIVTDEASAVPLPTFQTRDVAALADFLLHWMAGRTAADAQATVPSDSPKG